VYHTQPEGFRYKKHTPYSTVRGPDVPRLCCLECGRTFSRRTFSLSYWRKRPELLRPVAAGLQAGSGHRQLARTLGCAPSTVTRISAFLGRHSILLLARALASLEGQLDEPVVLDHFETFELTQDLPVGIATPVGAKSWFVYGIDPVPTRDGYLGSARRVLNRLLPLVPEGRRLHIIGDGHPDYQRAVAQHPRSEDIRLETHPNPKRGPKGSPRSAVAKARDQAMFPVDLLHALLRHSLAAHKRETIAFGRRLNAIVERLFLTAIWRNFVKGVSERKNDPTTPAMRLGLTDRPWKWERVLGRRLFPVREKLSGTWLEIYRRDWTTPELPSNTPHRRVFAY